MNAETLEYILKQDLRILNTLKKSEQVDKQVDVRNPFPLIGPYHLLEIFVRDALTSVPAESDKWTTFASIYTRLTGHRNFSNFVLGMLINDAERDNEIPLDTFAFIMRHNRNNREFLLEGLDKMDPIELWFYFTTDLPYITLWKAILFQYTVYEKINGYMYLDLYTSDAIDYYIDCYYSDQDNMTHMKGHNSPNPFIVATHNFNQLIASGI